METEKNFTEPSEKDVLGPDGGPPATTVEDLPAAHALTAEEIEELKIEAAKAKEHWDQLLRTAADFDNFKKRTARERQELIRHANESLLQRLIPLLDSLESALLSANPGQPMSVESLQTGLKMIQQQFKSLLSEAGVEEIEAANKAFDPNWHEALSQQERADVPEGQVVQQVRKGYKLRDRLLRPAAVVVAKSPAKKPSA